MSRIMGIDFGIVRSGIAVTDPLQIIVNPLDVVETKKIFEFLENYFTKENVSKIVIGQAKHPDGTEFQQEKQIEDLIKWLGKTFPDIEIDRQDESFTSVESREIILKSGFKKKKRQEKALVDKISAVLILQRYLKHI